jgi:hypothetical protein
MGNAQAKKEKGANATRANATSLNMKYKEFEIPVMDTIQVASRIKEEAAIANDQVNEKIKLSEQAMEALDAINNADWGAPELRLERVKIEISTAYNIKAVEEAAEAVANKAIAEQEKAQFIQTAILTKIMTVKDELNIKNITERKVRSTLDVKNAELLAAEQKIKEEQKIFNNMPNQLKNSAKLRNSVSKKRGIIQNKKKLEEFEKQIEHSTKQLSELLQILYPLQDTVSKAVQIMIDGERTAYSAAKDAHAAAEKVRVHLRKILTDNAARAYEKKVEVPVNVPVNEISNIQRAYAKIETTAVSDADMKQRMINFLTPYNVKDSEQSVKNLFNDEKLSKNQLKRRILLKFHPYKHLTETNKYGELTKIIVTYFSKLKGGSIRHTRRSDNRKRSKRRYRR